MFDYPAIHSSELFYSYVLRYHLYSGNRSVQQSFGEFYKLPGNIDSVLFPKQIADSIRGIGMDLNTYLLQHSVFPFYRLFLTDKKYGEICEDMMNSKQPYIMKLLNQRDRGTVNKSDRLYYCPICVEETNGYESIQSYQQIKGVHVCAKHHCHLNSIPLRPYKRLSHVELWDRSVKFEWDTSILNGIAEDAQYIMAKKPQFDIESLRRKLRHEAEKRNIYIRNRWFNASNMQWENQYEQLPDEYASYRNTFSFERYAAIRRVKAIEPIEYLLFIRIVFGSFQAFIETE